MNRHHRAWCLSGPMRAVVEITACFILATVAVAAAVPERAKPGIDQFAASNALLSGDLGLFPAANFRLVRGSCGDCSTLKEALWYFRDDLIAVPKPEIGSAGYSRGMAAQDDVRAWYSGAGNVERRAHPPLVWVGSPALFADVRLQADGSTLRLKDGSDRRFVLAPRLATNRAYFDASTGEFFRPRELRIRGAVAAGPDGDSTIVARTIWPQDYVIDAAGASLSPLSAAETLSGLVRQNEANTRYETRIIWERSPGKPRAWAGMAALGIMLNGAQGDDDEAHGGHFAIATGRLGASGEWADWMVNNFYNLDSVSEKGIVAAIVPMDNYLMDLNSGQAYYRPSHMVVALLRDDRVPLAYQGAVSRVYNHFYRHDFRYRHAAANCAGISLDTLRSLGWAIPGRGATSRLKAVAAYPYMAIKDRSLDSGRQSFDYLREEQTRLYPAVAFDAAGNDLLNLLQTAAGGRPAKSEFERMLKEDIEAIIFVRIPQIPSSRAQGTFAVASIDEYMNRVPEDRAQWKIVPVDARPFPDEFVNADTEPATQETGGTLLVTVLLFGGGIIAFRHVRKRRGRARKAGDA